MNMDKTTLEDWMEKIRGKRIRVRKLVSTDLKTLCLNFRQVPDTRVSILTVTFYNNNAKSYQTLPQTEFGKAMSLIENALSNADEEYSGYCKEGKHKRFEELDDDKLFVALNKEIGIADFCKDVGCHKCFFIPVNSVDIVQKHILNENTKSMLFLLGVQKISVFTKVNLIDEMEV